MKENIYLKSFEIGYDNLKGISFEQLKKKLKNDLLKDEYFEFHFNIWFYNNFFQEKAELYIVRHNNFANDSAQLKFKNWSLIKTYNNEKSFLKGDSVSKYIDYLELKESRISSSRAFVISIISVFIACLSVIAQIIFSNNFPPSSNIEKSENRNNTTESKFENSDSLKLRKSQMSKTENKSSSVLENNKPKNDTIN